VLLIQEAGGLVSDFAGGNEFMESGNVVTANPKVFRAMLQKIRPHLSADLAK
jgi:myo-inositol-1(or 4)-monophosphatase